MARFEIGTENEGMIDSCAKFEVARIRLERIAETMRKGDTAYLYDRMAHVGKYKLYHLIKWGTAYILTPIEMRYKK